MPEALEKVPRSFAPNILNFEKAQSQEQFVKGKLEALEKYVHTCLRMFRV
jgi:hypothetical protein